MGDIETTDGRGSYLVGSWQEIRKSGGRSLAINEIENILKKGDNTLLSREEVLSRTVDYFNSCVKEVEDPDTGELIPTWVRNPTKSGYALALGVDRFTLQTYLNNEDANGRPFKEVPSHNRIIANADFDILRRACTLIETFYEEKLGDNRNNAGTIFWLNNVRNSKWSNTQEFVFGDNNTHDNLVTIDQLPKLEINENNYIDVDTKSVDAFPNLENEEN